MAETTVDEGRYYETPTTSLKKASILKALADIGKDPQSVGLLAKNLFEENPPQPNQAKIDMSIINWGRFAQIIKGVFTDKRNSDKQPFAGILSRGLTPSGLSSATTDTFRSVVGRGLTSLQDKLALSLIEQVSNRQVEYDYHAMGYVRESFEKHNVPFKIPKPFFIDRRRIKSSERGEQSVPILFTEFLDGYSEMNPLREGNAVRMSINHTTCAEAVKKAEYEIEDEPLQHEVKAQMIDLLASVYCASGCLPGLFSPLAGDVLVKLDENTKPMPDLTTDDVQLGLITFRGGLVKLEDYDSDYGAYAKLLAKGRQPTVGFKKPDNPDFVLLRKKLLNMRFYCFTYEEEGPVTGCPYALFTAAEVGEGMVRAAGRYYDNRELDSVLAALERLELTCGS